MGTIVVLVEGAPTGVNVLSAEHLLISEGIPQKDGPILGTPAASSSAATMDVVSEVIAETPVAHTESNKTATFHVVLALWQMVLVDRVRLCFNKLVFPCFSMPVP